MSIIRNLNFSLDNGKLVSCSDQTEQKNFSLVINANAEKNSIAKIYISIACDKPETLTLDPGTDLLDSWTGGNLLSHIKKSIKVLTTSEIASLLGEKQVNSEQYIIDRFITGFALYIAMYTFLYAGKLNRTLPFVINVPFNIDDKRIVSQECFKIMETPFNIYAQLSKNSTLKAVFRELLGFFNTWSFIFPEGRKRTEGEEVLAESVSGLAKLIASLSK